MNWKWPNGKTKYGHDNGYYPWYNIIRRALAIPFIFLGVVWVFVFVVLAAGLQDAKRLRGCLKIVFDK